MLKLWQLKLHSAQETAAEELWAWRQNHIPFLKTFQFPVPVLQQLSSG